MPDTSVPLDSGVVVVTGKQLPLGYGSFRTGQRFVLQYPPYGAAWWLRQQNVQPMQPKKPAAESPQHD
jgi:hypothetical protein